MLSVLGEILDAGILFESKTPRRVVVGNDEPTLPSFESRASDDQMATEKLDANGTEVLVLRERLVWLRNKLLLTWDTS